mgnify:CR=1 FL=1
MDLDKYFKKAELIPAIVTDIDTGAVLMLAYMNKESLKISMEKGLTCFWSRSRQEFWVKKPSGALEQGRYIGQFAEGNRHSRRLRR